MSVSPSEDAGPSPAFELKGGSFTLPVLRLLQTDVDSVSHDLAAKVAQAPDFFRNTPVVIDLHVVEDKGEAVDFALLVGLLRGYGMVPVGVRGGSQVQQDAACALELAILADLRPKVAKTGAQRSVDAQGRQAPAASVKSRLVDRPVRSGQRVYASGADLVVTAPVSSGAELLADGNIHVYSSLRGRALAGLKGDRNARIFCHNLQAELISVAGHYRVSEDLDESVRDRPVQIYLDGDRLVIAPF